MSGLLQSMKAGQQRDKFYYDEDHNYGYHLHLFADGSLVCIKHMIRKAKPIDMRTFIRDVNSLCYGQAISKHLYISLIGGGNLWEKYNEWVEQLAAM